MEKIVASDKPLPELADYYNVSDLVKEKGDFEMPMLTTPPSVC